MLRPRPPRGRPVSIPLRTSDLARAIADYTARLGFVCCQHIPGVMALLRHGPLQAQLWACAAPAGRFERLARTDLPAERFVPGDHSVVVSDIEALYDSLERALHRAGLVPATRLSPGGALVRPWGAREFELRDLHGNRIHCVDWGVWQPDPARLTRFEVQDHAPDDAAGDGGECFDS